MDHPSRLGGRRPFYDAVAGPLALLAALAAWACGGETPAPAVGSGLSVEPAVLDLGRLAFGASTQGAYTLRNLSEGPLTLTRVGPTNCPCARLALELPDRGVRTEVDRHGDVRLTLAPGEEARLVMDLDTSRYRTPESRKHGAFAVLLEGGGALRLEWEVDIWTPFWVEPWAVELGRVGVRQQASGTVGVQHHDESSFSLFVPEEVDGWRLELLEQPDDKGDAYRIRVTAPPELPRGPFVQEFQFQSDLSGAPPVRFTAQGYAEADLTWSPKVLLLAAGDGSREAALTLRTRAVGGRFSISTVEVLAEVADEYEWDLEDREEGRAWQVVLRHLGPPPAAPRAGSLRIRTTDLESPVVEVPFRLEPPPKGPAGQDR